MEVEKTDVVQSHILGTLVNGVISTSIDYKMIVLVPISEDCSAMHDSRTWRSP